MRARYSQLFLYIVLTVTTVRGQDFISERRCGVLHSGGNFTGSEFILNDHGQSVSLAEDFRVSEFGWNTTASLRVESACKLELWNEPYFDGIYQAVEQGEHPSLKDFDVSSVKCSCFRECKCSDIFMRKNTCARAYVKRGCNTCNAMYVDLLGSKTIFPDDFVDKVKALRLRKGCTLTIYDEEDHQGEQRIIESEIVEDFDGEIRSYECDCDDDAYEPRQKPPRPASYPQLVEVPNTLDEVISMLKNDHVGHPGLIAAYKSLKRGRSSKNAYILLIGSTGAGKSSAINLLFDNPHITTVGGDKSTTTDLHEFRIPVPIDELGIANSELRVIDTPGLGDTRGLEQDAKFLASLDEFLTSHEELKNKIPNVVLVFHKFTDNRFDGIGSNFVKMLRGLDNFRERITDENYSNVIFVMSHFCTVSKEIRRRPDAKLKRFKEVIENYSMFPKPTLISLAENKAREQELPMLNGYFKLPNNEFYPRNLFEKLELVTDSGSDLIGLSVFRTAFRDSENVNVTSSTFQLVGESSSKVPHYLAILTNAIFNVNNTDVSKMLKDAHDDMDTALKKKYPDALSYLQKSLNIRQINTKEEIPKTTTAILELLMAIKRNEATTYLLEKALNIKAPVFQHNTVAGYGYNVFKDSALHSSPFILGDLQHSDMGFMIPKVLSCNIEQKDAENFIIFDTKQQYLDHRLRSLGIDGDIPENNFIGRTKAGHNIREISFKNDSCSVSATREVRIFEFVLNDRLDLTKEFIAVIKSLPVFNGSDHVAVEKWKNFFTEYGTHVVKSVHSGGEIEIQISSNQPFNSDVGHALFDLIKFAEDMSFEINDINGNGTSTNKTVLRSGISHSLTFHGGDQNYHTSDLTKLSIEDAGALLTKWQKSLKYNPIVLKTEMRLLPMSQVVRKLGQNYSSEIERATSLLFNSSLVYVPPRARDQEPGLSRDDTPLMIELLKMQRESNAQILNLTMEMKMLELENQKRVTQLQEERLKWEREQQAINEEHKIQQRLAEQKAEVDRRQWEQQLENARRKSEMERDELNRKQMQALADAQKAADQRLRDFIRQTQTTPAPARSRRSSCLKEGTKILMADWTEKSVETLRIGEFILDANMKPTRVLGVSYEFLLSQRFYGFDDKMYFFTDSHLFVGPGLRESEEFSYYAQSPSMLYSQNPLMKYLNVNNMEDGITLFHTNITIAQTQLELESKQVQVFQDLSHYSEDTKIYFIQVDNTAGTYIANSFVCRHEIPPIQHWPYAMAVLFKVMGTPIFEQISQYPYTIETVNLIDTISEEVAAQVKHSLELVYDNNESSSEGYELITLDKINTNECIGNIFGNPTLAALGVGLYGNVGPILANYIDETENPALTISVNHKARVQHIVFNVMSVQLEKSFRKLKNL